MSLFRAQNWSRREVLKQSGMLSALGAATAASPLAASAAILANPAEPAALPARTGTETDNLFTRIGVRPILNAHGTFTIIGGSRSLPQVKQAMFDASHYYVHLDEMMNGIGARLAELTGAEWGIATTGCEAAICLATIACIAGADIEKCQALPYVKAKDQVIIPRHSRNPYDFGVRMAGVEIVEVDSAEDLRAKLSERTAMVYILSGPAAEKGPLSIKNICAIAKEKNVPIFVDAAAEEPVTPNIHLAVGATLVGYSGGKCMRGPQSSGMLIGQKDLCKAAYFQAAPHHNYGRALKCSKEEAMGLLAAVEQWYKRDHAAEQRQWRSWLNLIEARLKPLPSTRFEYLEADDLSNNAPRLRIHWDAAVLKITGTEMVAKLDAGTPRILVDGGTGRRPDSMASTLTIMPYMMDPGEERILADTLFAYFSKPGPYTDPVLPTSAPAAMQGQWAVTIHYVRGTGEQTFTLEQTGNTLTGTHKGELYTAALKGTVHGDQVELHSTMDIHGGGSIPWNFKGTAQGSNITGTIQMGEYGAATWKATRA